MARSVGQSSFDYVNWLRWRDDGGGKKIFWSIDSVVYILIIDLIVGKWQVQVNVVVAVLRCCRLRLEEYQRFFKGLIVVCISWRLLRQICRQFGFGGVRGIIDEILMNKWVTPSIACAQECGD